MLNRKSVFISLLFTLGAIIPGTAGARTWYVNAFGTGDAPTIAAALDSAAAGDTVLVGPGEYVAPGGVGAHIVVASEMGPLRTRVSAAGPGLSPYIFSLLDRSEVHGFWVTGAYLAQIATGPNCLISDNIIDGVPGNHVSATDACTISNNLFLAGPGSGIAAYHQLAVFQNNIIECPIQCTVLPIVTCNNILSPDSPCLQEILQAFGTGNFSSDPEFCGIEGSDNYYLQSDSPCAPGNTPLAFDCGLIGPLPVGCSTVSTEERSWGEIKALYR